jgi:hypothetical protein
MSFKASSSKVKHISVAIRESEVMSEHIVKFCKTLARDMKVLVLLETGDLIPDVIADIWNGVTTRAVGYHQAIFSDEENQESVERFARNHVSFMTFIYCSLFVPSVFPNISITLSTIGTELTNLTWWKIEFSS